jgi:hypothetical protein
MRECVAADRELHPTTNAKTSVLGRERHILADQWPPKDAIEELHRSLRARWSHHAQRGNERCTHHEAIQSHLPLRRSSHER